MTSEQFKQILRLAHANIPTGQHGNAASVGTAIASATFAARGNHSEVHLSERELAALLTAAAELRRTW